MAPAAVTSADEVINRPWVNPRGSSLSARAADAKRTRTVHGQSRRLLSLHSFLRVECNAVEDDGHAELSFRNVLSSRAHANKACL